jgi:hypothetical protein
MATKGGVKIAKKTLKDPEVLNLFSQMVGTGEPDPAIVSPKYEAILQLCKETISLLKDAFLKEHVVPIGILNNFKQGFVGLETFCKDSEQDIIRFTLTPQEGALGGKDLKELNKNTQLLQEYLQSFEQKYKITELGPTYKELKASSLVRKIVMTARDIKEILDLEKKHAKSEKSNLENDKELKDDFIINYDGDYLQLLKSITILDFKQMWLHSAMTIAFKQRVLYALHLLHKKALALYKQISSPDVDTDKFAEVLVQSIDKIKQVPELNRCDKAFGKIKSSVDMLKNNFGEYYKDFIQSNNPSIIIENFVMDVAKSHSSDLATTGQFKAIVNYYRKALQGKTVDPKIDKMFDLVRDNIGALEDKQKKEISSSSSSKPDDTKPKVEETEKIEEKEKIKEEELEDELKDVRDELKDEVRDEIQKDKPQKDEPKDEKPKTKGEGEKPKKVDDEKPKKEKEKIKEGDNDWIPDNMKSYLRKKKK